jgi:hypothetical protein
MVEKVAVLVACGKDKRDKRSLSWKLYESTLFEKSWAAASVIGHPYVMSAKHGLLSPDERIDPYEETLKKYTDEEKKEWGEKVLSNLSDHYEEVVLLGGRDYVEPIKEANGGEYDIRDPYKSTTGNGQQMSVAGEIVEALTSGDGM